MEGKPQPRVRFRVEGTGLSSAGRSWALERHYEEMIPFQEFTPGVTVSLTWIPVPSCPSPALLSSWQGTLGCYLQDYTDPDSWDFSSEEGSQPRNGPAAGCIPT